MKKPTTWRVAAAIVIIGTALAARAKDTAEVENAAAAIAAAYSAYASPGKHHEHLAARVGSWSVRVTTWQAPDAPPQVSNGTSEIEMIMGGRYLLENFTSQFETGAFTGMGITAYDNLKERYVATWIDSMSTGIMVAESTGIDERKVEYRGEGPEPVSGTYIEVRSVEHRVNPNTYRFETFIAGANGEEFKNMEIVYTRK